MLPRPLKGVMICAAIAIGWLSLSPAAPLRAQIGFRQQAATPTSGPLATATPGPALNVLDVQATQIALEARDRDNLAIAAMVAADHRATQQALDTQAHLDAARAEAAQFDYQVGAGVVAVVLIVAGVLAGLLLVRVFIWWWRAIGRLRLAAPEPSVGGVVIEQVVVERPAPRWPGEADSGQG